MATDRLLSVHSCYDLNPFSAFRTLSLMACVTDLPCPAPARTVPDGSRHITIHAPVMHRDVVLVPTSDGRTTEVAVSSDPETISRCSYDLLFYHSHLIEFAGQGVYNMLSLLNLCTDAHNQIMVRMPSFIADVVVEASRRGFSELVVHAYGI